MPYSPARAPLLLVLTLGMVAGFGAGAAAAKRDPCKASCVAEKRGCQAAARAAFQAAKADCPGSGKAKRECVKTARGVLRAAARSCRELVSTCRSCCAAGGVGCDVQCGDGIVGGGEDCDPPGGAGCPGDVACGASCECPPGATTTSSPAVTTTIAAPTSSTVTTTIATTTTTVPPCNNGIKDGNETAVDCGGGTCGACADGLACSAGSDCLSQFCENDLCKDPCDTQPAGSPCANDGNACTIDTCDGSNCQHAPVDAGTVCRSSAGPCDVAEECDGTGAPCPGDSLLTGDVCRPSQGGCDEEEACDGLSPQCPPDVLAHAGATCRVASGVCDQAETCSGTSPVCPANAFLSSGTVCRAAAGVCDAAETCTGSSKDCPDDVLESGTVCRASGGACDVTETCDGANPDCPTDVKVAAGTSCLSQGPESCIADFLCDGVNPGCGGFASPKPQGAVCRPPVGSCDAAEVCDGQTFGCPTDVRKPSTSICRSAQGECDVTEYCTGFGSACPDDAKKSPTAICRAAATAMDGTTCDLPETCTGDSNDCPDDVVQPAGNVCRPSTGNFGPGTAGHACDAPESCTGLSAACPADQKLPLGTVCGTATECRAARTCKGTCTGTPGGTACASNAECAGGTCFGIGPQQIYACASPAINEGGSCDNDSGLCQSGTCTSRVKAFGGTCDGHDFFVIGDPDKRFCGDDPNYKDLVCCAGPGLAKNGQTGTCRECCNSLYDEDNGGCYRNEYNTQECCDGVCKDTGFDPDNCGVCGNKCSDYANECTDPNVPPTCGKVEIRCNLEGRTPPACCEEVLGCTEFVSEGYCNFQSVCTNGLTCIPTITSEDAARVNNSVEGCDGWKACLNWDRSDPLTPCTLRLGGDLRDVECPLSAHPLMCVAGIPLGHCGPCSTNSDCESPDVCLSGCGDVNQNISQGPFIFCSEPGICARDYEECR